MGSISYQLNGTDLTGIEFYRRLNPCISETQQKQRRRWVSLMLNASTIFSPLFPSVLPPQSSLLSPQSSLLSPQSSLLSPPSSVLSPHSSLLPPQPFYQGLPINVKAAQ
ncbi:hypothetical protein [Coleofasciculus sp. H7-2]|uniref:hypothetical protein n=1 Tax=Coleofasciculus sp. H7-2 TaxID=3351545 RepID=UPI00366AF96B